MPFLITNLIQNSISHLETGHTVPACQAPRGTYFEKEHFNDVCWYVKNHYIDPDLNYGSSTLNFTDKFGGLSGEKTLDHLVFRIKRSSVSKHFLALSFNLKLYSYFPGLENEIRDNSKDFPARYLVLRDISKGISSRYDVQCIDLSDNNEFIFYSNRNKIFRLDYNLRTLEVWEIPDKFNRDNKATSPERQQALLILGLRKDPSIDEIRLAFRQNLLKVHPDINRKDPNATEKTRAVLESYEILTRGISSQEDNSVDADLFQIAIAFSGDSVTATQVRYGTEDLYVGCYSGKTYLLLSNGKSKLIYDGHAPIRKIRESGKYLYIIGNQFWDILFNGMLINHIEANFGFDRILLEVDCNAVIIDNRIIRLYSFGGIAFAEVSFSENIADAYIYDQKLKVLTVKKSYLFTIQPPSDYGILAQVEQKLLPE